MKKFFIDLIIQRNAWKIKKKVMSFDEFYSVFHINPKPGNPIPLGAGRKGFFLQKNKKYFIKIWLLTLVTSVMQIQNWYFCRMLRFPKKKLYRDFEISFSVTIPKNSDDIRIDVLDEAFCQPYDYQRILYDHPNHETALIVQNEIEKWMDYLQKKGALSGHVRGEYI